MIKTAEKVEEEDTEEEDKEREVMKEAMEVIYVILPSFTSLFVYVGVFVSTLPQFELSWSRLSLVVCFSISTRAT